MSAFAIIEYLNVIETIFFRILKTIVYIAFNPSPFQTDFKQILCFSRVNSPKINLFIYKTLQSG